MGKYMRKSKGTGGVALMEVSHTQSSLGVRTRAKTLALQRLQNSAPAATGDTGGGGSYLQLRSRRLEKLSPVVLEGKRQKHHQKDLNLQSRRGSSSSRVRVKGSGEDKKEEKEKVIEENLVNLQGNEEEEESKKSNDSGGDLGVEEASFGDNVLEFEGRERTTRESTPCNLIRDPDTIRTPGSSTRPTIASEANNRENAMRRHIPTAREMDEFFAGAEEQQQRKFVEKYNFDPVNDKPLPGRYEWEKLNP